MKPILIIDAGHGGRDPGGGSNQYWTEKNLNLSISLYQFERYKELGIPVALTRRTDITLNPKSRTRIVRDSGALYCHSNHINAGGGDGAEIIHSIYGDIDMAEKMAEAIREAGQNVRRVFTRKLPTNPKRDFYYMNRNTGKVNTAIIEYGFADSDGDDVNQLRKQWKRYAEAVVKAFCQYIDHPYNNGAVSTAAKMQQKVLHLPVNAPSWRVYAMHAIPIKGNEKGFLRPKKFGGLTYEVLGSPQAHVYIIQTRDFGKVQIYAHPSTGAVITA
ncbi:N-acetylmuramoyl-L-alanine amidase family protein [Virgibacillus siamensis]|uniref:N-acetylmuramoyl-L-alanine amidase family protein n=1 Tax=Virgibacillus siamensis TaxID=480071 RepID=UPI00158A96A4|nr:N-acetylmuramoyl-L-alanine amidase [Virgibacillus siamensis]